MNHFFLFFFWIGNHHDPFLSIKTWEKKDNMDILDQISTYLP